MLGFSASELEGPTWKYGFKLKGENPSTCVKYICKQVGTCKPPVPSSSDASTSKQQMAFTCHHDLKMTRTTMAANRSAHIRFGKYNMSFKANTTGAKLFSTRDPKHKRSIAKILIKFNNE